MSASCIFSYLFAQQITKQSLKYFNILSICDFSPFLFVTYRINSLTLFLRNFDISLFVLLYFLYIPISLIYSVVLSFFLLTLPANAENTRDSGSIPGKIPWRRALLPTQVFLPGEFHGQRSLAGHSHGVRESQTRLSK